MFSSNQVEEAAGARPEDRSLADVLRQNRAALIADLVLKYEIGKRITAEKEFTLIIPSDEGMGRVPLTSWNALNDPRQDAFEKWIQRHHAAKRVMKSDVAKDSTGKPVSALEMDDGTSYTLSLEGGDFKINNVRVLTADIPWGKGVIHIVTDELGDAVGKTTTAAAP
jgi:uncharacterized surface protein with fasciclin (FAS1) repeats